MSDKNKKCIVGYQLTPEQVNETNIAEKLGMKGEVKPDSAITVGQDLDFPFTLAELEAVKNTVEVTLTRELGDLVVDQEIKVYLF